MSGYLGLDPNVPLLNSSTQFFSGNSAATQFTLARSVSSASDLDVLIGNVPQRPGVDYTALNTSIVFTSAPGTGTNNITVTYRAGALNSLTLQANSFPSGTVGAPGLYSVAANNTGLYWPTATDMSVTVAGVSRANFSSNVTSTSNTTGALTVAGGVGVTGNINTSGLVNITNTTQSTSVSTGALQVAGGAGIVGNVNIGGDITCVGDFTVNGVFRTTGTDSLEVADPFIFLANANPGDSFDSGIITEYNDGVVRYAGLFRDITDDQWKLFGNLTVKPGTTVDTGDASFNYNSLTLASLSATGNVTGTYFIGNGALLTGISTDTTNINNGTSTVRIPSINGNVIANVAGNTIATVSGSGIAVTGAVSATTTVSATGNVTGGNLVTGGLITATGTVTAGAFSTAGNVIGANINTAGLVSATGAVNSSSVTATGNIVGGNINTAGLVSATGAITGAAITGTSLTVSTGNITAGNLLLSGAIIDASQLDIQTSAANSNIVLTPNGTGQVRVDSLLSVVGNVIGGNLRSEGQLFVNALTTGQDFNIRTISGSGNATFSGFISAIGNIAGGNLRTAGLISATGNIIGGNISTAGLITATGSIQATGAITGAAISGTTISGSGNVTGANVNTAGLVSATGNIIGGNISTAGSITATGSIQATGNTNGGNLNATSAVVAGTTVSAGGNVTGGNILTTGLVSAGGTVSATGNITGGNFNTAGLVSATGNINATGNVFGGNVIGNLAVIGAVISSTGNITATGNVSAGNLLAAGLSLSGNVLSAIATTGNITSGNLITTGLVSATGQITGSQFNGSGAGLTSIPGANVTGTVASATTAGTVTTAAQPNITSVGTLSSLAVTGNITAGNLTGAALLSATNLTGTLTTAAQPNITSVGTLTSLAVTGNISGGNVNSTFYGSGAGLSSIAGANVTGTVASATSATTAGTVTTAAQPNITSVGTLSSLSVTGNTTGGNLLTGGLISATGQITGSQFNGSGAGLTSIPGANVTGTVASATRSTNLAGGSAGTIPYQTGANTTAMLAAGTSGYFLKSNNTSAPSWNELSLTDIPDAWVKKSVKVATTANITLSGAQTIDGIALVAGDRVLVKDQATASENGIYIVAAGAWSRSSDADTISELAGACVNVDSGTTNGGFRFDTDLKTTDTLGTTAVSFYRVTDSNDAATANTANKLVLRDANGSFGANVVTATSFSGSGASITSINATNISSGTLAQARLANASVTLGSTALTLGATVTTIAGLSSVTSTTFVGSLSGAATTAGTVTTAAQPNITSVGTLSSLAVTGNITAGNVSATLFTGTATQARYADLAEMYLADQDYAPGTVLIFGGENEVTIAMIPGDDRIAGVVSTDPAHLMNSAINGEYPVPVALTGRVPTLVLGPVAKGDMMVSAGNGRAMACSTPVIGSVIGKALEDFVGVEGTIEIVVGRL